MCMSISLFWNVTCCRFPARSVLAHVDTWASYCAFRTKACEICSAKTAPLKPEAEKEAVKSTPIFQKFFVLFFFLQVISASVLQDIKIRGFSMEQR